MKKIIQLLMMLLIALLLSSCFSSKEAAKLSNEALDEVDSIITADSLKLFEGIEVDTINNVVIGWYDGYGANFGSDHGEKFIDSLTDVFFYADVSDGDNRIVSGVNDAMHSIDSMLHALMPDTMMIIDEAGVYWVTSGGIFKTDSTITSAQLDSAMNGWTSDTAWADTAGVYKTKDGIEVGKVVKDSMSVESDGENKYSWLIPVVAAFLIMLLWIIFKKRKQS